MRPEPAAGAWEAPGRVCHCPGNGPPRPSSPRQPESSSPTPWRPWTQTPGDAELTRTGSLCEPAGQQQTLRSKGVFGFQHPVRLYLPISKRQEYLRSSGEQVLASFPVQATIHFYNDESEPDSDEEEQEDTQTYHLQCHEYEGGQESGLGGQGRGGLLSPPRGRDGLRGGLHGKGQLPHGDSPGGSECFSSK
ncbi:protein ripply3 isoform X2 [Sciurus carolinensis]|uniref:protein ripply3 isoform X2 n=1 Tax=Sciurus carolinensis TaxID=30640 RepID=UPI001FB1C20E|nr:protein ripply3 isoform X2 [Sciurus carolinensis]